MKLSVVRCPDLPHIAVWSSNIKACGHISASPCLSFFLSSRPFGHCESGNQNLTHPYSKLCRCYSAIIEIYAGFTVYIFISIRG